jgi:hypothetical protein
MDAYFTLVMAAGAPAGDTVNIWGMLGCAVAYAGALFAAVDGMGDHLLHRRDRGPEALPALRLKIGSKLGAAAITVVTAGIVLLLDGNWWAFGLLTAFFITIVVWVLTTYRKSAKRA